MAKRNKPALFAVIMAGGKGRRFWPKGRAHRPKQLLPIGSGEPLVRETVKRLLPAIPAERVFISCGKDLAPDIAAVLPEVPWDNFIVEPVGRDTAPCVGLSVEHVLRRSPEASEDSVIAILPADHCIKKPGKFRTALKQAAAVAHRGEKIVTIGILPGRPSSAYGYIQPGKELAGGGKARALKKFVEKPGEKTARRYLEKGYLWNAGMFVFRIDVMRRAYAEHLPGMHAGLTKIGDAMNGPSREKVLEMAFPKLQKISLDYGIMEKVDNAAVVPGDFGWTDVGGWDALYRLLGGDGEKSVTRGEVELVDSKGCYAEGEKTIALVGVEGLVVVETDDAILVLKREREEEIKQLTDRLERSGRDDLL